MSLEWIHENPARWDAAKAAVVATAPPGVFDFSGYTQGALLPGDWWRVERGGKVVGYGWMDATWGDAEVLLCVSASERNGGVGSFIMDHLEREAGQRGLNHLYNVIPSAHPDPARLSAWLTSRRFAPSEDGKVLRRVVARPR